MLEAVIADLISIPNYNIITCIQEDLTTAIPNFSQWEQDGRLQVHRVGDPREEQACFEQACRQSDIVWIIAPEFDEILSSRTERAIQLGAYVVGSDLKSINLSADKWRLYEFLHDRSIPTISTLLLESQQLTFPCTFPCVIKHRFGAGGLGLHYFTQLDDWQEQFSHRQVNHSEYIVQPFVSGKMLSAVVLVNSHCREFFPIGEQRICWESGFQYQGGAIPSELAIDVTQSVQNLLQRLCNELPGLAGYVGFDLLLPDENPTDPLVVEINPRLTTSYTGYRQLTQENLAQRIVDSETAFPLLKWDETRGVQFRPDGTVLINQMQS
ncbi:ATP-grasp domain-containing protein [Gimesia aquarii]|uniref:Carbamoyl phosphate synthase-like protein n=1 Tax=Gimesia aquarii TaxID=2527964 RepID=A0A517WRE6_9PLAN|nr:ATP-grasp domain-containing protein [Gimesia aquarii]QDU07831.1 carbamoyl phosphate synthase-like protein [Gimesia aquarii]